MAYDIIFIEKAANEFSEIDAINQHLIGQFIQPLAKEDDQRTLGSPLEENLSRYWKFRIGDYALIAEIHDDLLVVLLLADVTEGISARKLMKG